MHLTWQQFLAIPAYPTAEPPDPRVRSMHRLSTFMRSVIRTIAAACCAFLMLIGLNVGSAQAATVIRHLLTAIITIITIITHLIRTIIAIIRHLKRTIISVIRHLITAIITIISQGDGVWGLIYRPYHMIIIRTS